MFKRIAGSLIITALCTSSAMAQSAYNSTAATGSTGNGSVGFAPANVFNTTAATGSQGNSDGRTTQTNADYQHQSWGDTELAPQGQSAFTNNQGVGSINGPILPGTPSYASGPGSSSGAATGAPFAGTFLAPANMALKALGRPDLPETRLESFVRESGFNPMIYGDEGEGGIPPYSSFSVIDSGITGDTAKGLTTGHKSDAPSAWGYPQ